MWNFACWSALLNFMALQILSLGRHSDGKKQSWHQHLKLQLETQEIRELWCRHFKMRKIFHVGARYPTPRLCKFLALVDIRTWRKNLCKKWSRLQHSKLEKFDWMSCKIAQWQNALRKLTLINTLVYKFISSIVEINLSLILTTSIFLICYSSFDLQHDVIHSDWLCVTSFS